MPTRKASDFNGLNQNRYSSSCEYEKAILGNLVARRAGVITDTEDRALVYWLQGKSNEEGGLEKVCKLFVERNQEMCLNASLTQEVLHKYLWELCLDPEMKFPEELPFEQAQAMLEGASRAGSHMQSFTVSRLRRHGWFPGFGNVIDALKELIQEEAQEACDSIAETSISRQIWDDLEYCLFSKKLVVIEGRERMGKSVTAEAFCRAHPGKCAFVRLEPGDDENSFFRSIAAALGTARTAQRKTNEVRARIEDTLQQRHLMLILDEAHFLWPQRQRVRSAPKKIDWIRAALVDCGVAVALISTPQFLDQCHRCDNVSGWNSGQVKGRIGLHRQLPETLSRADVTAIVNHLEPGLDSLISGKVALRALQSDSRVAFIDIIFTRARFFAARRGARKLNSSDVEAALKERGATACPGYPAAGNFDLQTHAPSVSVERFSHCQK